MTGIVYDDLFLEHGEVWHPENRQRLEITMDHLREAGWLERLVSLEFGPAAPQQVAWLHDEDYVGTVAEMSELGGGAFDADTIATSHTYAAAMLAAGGAIAAAGAAISDAPARSICLLRPPGHHALAHRAMGFCFFNNAALAAEAALREGAQRVAIVDFDVHHGNGTQDTFYRRRDVLYVSLHETPLYPGTGTLDEVGVEYRGVIGRHFVAKGLDVEGDGGSNVGEGLFVGVALADDDAPQSEGVGHEAIGMLLDQNPVSTHLIASGSGIGCGGGCAVTGRA